MEFTGLDGWPCEFEDSPFGKGLIDALRALPLGDELNAEKLSGHARLLWAVAEGGRDQQLPRNIPASAKQTEKELGKIIELSLKLADQIEALHQPSVDALYSEGAHVFEHVETLRTISEYAQHAFPGDHFAGGGKGAPQKVEAYEVAVMASSVFEHITGNKATFTSDPHTGEVYGQWPEFLAKVYGALRISASVSSQVRAVSKKSRQI